MPGILQPDKFGYAESLCIYAAMVSKSSGFLNTEAVFSDETENFVEVGQDSAVIRIRCGKDNLDKIFICINGSETEMEKELSRNDFDFYSVTVKNIESNSRYYFKLLKEHTYYYNKKGLFEDLDETYNFLLIPGFTVPEWAKGAVMYQIYVDRFCNGDKTNTVVNNEYAYLSSAAKQVEDWFRPVSKEDFCTFYGGDLQGIINKIEYLADLGVEVIYLNPVFVSPSNHKYDTQDYDYVDPHIGVIVEDGGEPLHFEKFHNKFATKYIQRTINKANLEASNKLLCKLIELCHEKGIKVILDGVFNHCGAFNKWLDRENFYGSKGYPTGAYRSENSPYHNYFRWYDKNWPNNDCYDGWWGHSNHPKLNFEASPELYEYIMEVGRKWVSPPFNADGWRLDVAADLGYSKEFNHKFWRDFRKAVKGANPEAIILAEHYGDPKDWLAGDQWDTVMNYDAFMEPITWFLTGMEKHSEEYRGDMYCNTMAFEGAMRYFGARFPVQSLQVSMNQLSNHDHSRFLTRTNKTVGRLHTMGWEAADQNTELGVMLCAVTFQMTWPGAPTIYYGDEAGLTGWTDPDNRRTFPWGRENKLLQDFHKDIIAVHKSYSALKKGSLEYLFLDYGVLSYGRFDKENKIAVIINNNTVSKKLNIPVWKIMCNPNGTMQSLISTYNNQYSVEKVNYNCTGGMLSINVPPKSSVILAEV